jgi:LexA DNA binding domain
MQQRRKCAATDSVYDYMREHFDRLGFMPSTVDIRLHMRWKSNQAVVDTLSRLARHGRLVRNGKCVGRLVDRYSFGNEDAAS